MTTETSNNRTTIKDSVDDFIRLAQRGLRISEGLNPSIPCSLSNDNGTDEHAPAALYKPEDLSKKDIDFTSAF